MSRRVYQRFRAVAVHQSERRQKQILICIHLKSKCVSCTTWSKQDADLDTTCILSLHTERDESISGITASMLPPPGFGNTRSASHTRSHQTESASVCFGIGYRNETSQLLWLFFSWRRQKGKRVRVLCRTQGQPNYACVCVCVCQAGPSALSVISFLLRRGDVGALHGSTACHPSVGYSSHTRCRYSNRMDD